MELELLTDIDMPFMVEKGIRRRKCHAIHQYAILIFVDLNVIRVKNCHVLNTGT